MKFVGLMFVVALVCCSTSSADKIKTENEVYVLNEGNYKKAIKDVEKLLIVLYVPWCGWCTKLHPELDRAAAKLKEMKSPVKIGKVDCDMEKPVCRELKINAYPTMLIFTNGKPSEYTGARESDAIVKALTG